MLAELPDLWDATSAAGATIPPPPASKEGHQERYIGFVKSLTTKPVVGVGRYTSPDAMVSAIHRGIMDMIGSARPSIADPFLPKKIREGRMDIRECIGCNICVSADNKVVPIRCTQNPTMGEEWRHNWHPRHRSAPGAARRRCWLWAPVRPGWKRGGRWGSEATPVVLVEARPEPADAWCWKRNCRG